MLGSFPRPPLRAHTRDPNGHSQVSSARGAPHLPIDVSEPNSTAHGDFCAETNLLSGNICKKMQKIDAFEKLNLRYIFNIQNSSSRWDATAKLHFFVILSPQIYGLMDRKN